MQLYPHSTCLPPWHILVQPNFTLTPYLCTYLSSGHIRSGLIKEPFHTSLTVTCTLHDTFISSSLSNYINIMNSSNNKIHSIIFCVLLLTPSTDVFPQSSSKQIILTFSEVTFHTHKNERNVWFADGWNISLQVVLHMQRVTNYIFLFLKTTWNSFSRAKILFHKDTLIYRQAIPDTVCIHLAQERYKQWPILNRVETNLILYTFCASTVYLQYSIPICCTMFINNSHIIRPQFLAILVELVALLMCAVYMSMYLVTVCRYGWNYNYN